MEGKTCWRKGRRKFVRGDNAGKSVGAEISGDRVVTSIPRAQISVVRRTREVPCRKSCMIASRSFWGMSPCILDTVKFASLIFSVNQSTFRFVLQKMTACVIVSVSYNCHISITLGDGGKK